MIIYKATNSVNNKAYIGQTVKCLNDRKGEHLKFAKNGIDTYFHRALRKHGSNSFVWEILDDSTCKTIEQLNNMEIFYIAYYDTFKNGYNLTSGGRRCIIREETKQKISKSLLGTHKSDEFKKKCSDRMQGTVISEKVKRKISETKKSQMTDDIKNNISSKITQLWQDDVYRTKMSNSRRGLV
jgi:group I intron endonuclease